MVEDIYTKGFVKLYEPEGLDLIKIDKFTLMNVEERARDNGANDVPEELAARLNAFAYYLKAKYIDPEWGEDSKYNKFIVWDGVDRDNQGWHTDMFEGYDVFFLYYLDTMSEDTGGSINFKWGSLQGKEDVAHFYPKAGDLFMVNNMRGFWHRAESCPIQRRVASFDFNVGLKDNE